MQLKYRCIIKDLHLPNKREARVTAVNAYEAHKKGLKTVNLAKEDILKIFDSDNSLIYSFKKGFISAF